MRALSAAPLSLPRSYRRVHIVCVCVRQSPSPAHRALWILAVEAGRGALGRNEAALPSCSLVVCHCRSLDWGTLRYSFRRARALVRALSVWAAYWDGLDSYPSTSERAFARRGRLNRKCSRSGGPARIIEAIEGMRALDPAGIGGVRG